MQLLKIEKNKPFTTLYYELTWPIGWELMLSMVNAVIEKDFSKAQIESLEVGKIAGSALIDVTAELKRANNEIHYASFAKEEAGVLAIAGYSALMETSMRFLFYNQTNRCIVQIMMDKAIKKDGKHAYDKYMDSIELMGYIDQTERRMEKQLTESSPTQQA